MSIARKIGLSVLSILLVTALASANVVLAAHQTVLDPEFTKETLAEEEVYGELQTTMTETVTNGSATSSLGGGDGDNGSLADGGETVLAAVVDEAISEAYVRSQVNANIDRTYAYLHGNREEFTLAINLVPVKENVTEAIEEEIRNRSVATLLERSGVELSVGNQTVDADLIERMTANASAYQGAKADFRESVREEVVSGLVDTTYENATNDERLALVIDDYDSDDYSEDEKAQLVDERESEIRAAMREQIEDERGDEIDQLIEEQLDVLREAATNRESDPETETGAAALAVQETFVRALTTDMDYETFDAELQSAKADLAAALSDRLADQLDENVPDRHDLTEGMNEEGTQALETAATAVQWLDWLAVLLPIGALGLVGVGWWASRSVASFTAMVGNAALWAGLPTAIGTEIARDRLHSLVGDVGGPLADVLITMFDRTLGTLGAQSIALTAVGAGLLAVSIGLRYGLFDGIRGRVGEAGRAEDKAKEEAEDKAKEEAQAEDKAEEEAQAEDKAGE